MSIFQFVKKIFFTKIRKSQKNPIDKGKNEDKKYLKKVLTRKRAFVNIIKHATGQMLQSVKNIDN